MAAKKAMKAKKRVAKRAPRRQARIPRSLALKSYNYKFKLPAQILTSTAGAGSLVISPGVGAGGSPLVAAGLVGYPSTNNLPNFFDFAIGVDFKLSDIVNSPAFTAMYDAYKIRKITLSIEYLNNSSSANTTGLMPTLYQYWDQDDALPPPGAVSIQAKQGVKRFQFGNNSRTAFKTSAMPRLGNVLGVVGAGVSIAGITKPQYINCTIPTIAHHACKMWLADVYLPGSAAVTQAFRLNWTYDVSFRSPLLTA